MRGGYPPIGDYGIIGDCRTAALIGREGSLDWWCVPHFEGASIFGALLDRRRGGRFAVRPTGRFRSLRRYLPDTHVLETTFEADGGRVRLTDFMPALAERDKRDELNPEREILRLVEGLTGEVEIEVVCDPRPEYGLHQPPARDRGPLGIFWSDGRDALVLRSEVPLAAEGGQARGRETLHAGERRWISLSHTDADPAVLGLFGDIAQRKLECTIRWWGDWAARCRYEGPFREAVVRSALTIKLLAYAPSGAIIASPTTSLPEDLGGVRNWDYRYCWLRDSSLTIQSLLDLGYSEEATAFLSWILHAVRVGSTLRVLYDLHGRRVPAERDLDHLEGYAGSRPVRVGNAAQDQLQLDIYGEVCDAVAEYVRRGGRLDRESRRLLTHLGQIVCDRWQEPDHSIWEIRAEPRHHTYSRVMCWVALDRLIELHEAGALEVDVRRHREHRERILREVEHRGWSDELESYVDVLDGGEVDASLLLLQRYGFHAPDDPRIRSTCSRVYDRLSAGPFLYRYLGDDGLPGGEGAFGIASFWGVECRARRGDVEGAIEGFERIVASANDLGLFAEEIEPHTGEARGNFPQGFTHVGLIDAALTLAELTGEPIGHGQGRAAPMERVEEPPE